MKELPIIPDNASLYMPELTNKAFIWDFVETFLTELRLAHLLTKSITVVVDPYKIIISTEAGVFTITTPIIRPTDWVTFSPPGILDHFPIVNPSCCYSLMLGEGNPYNGIYFFTAK